MASLDLARAAETTVERLGVAAGESLLVVCNGELAPIAEAIAAAARLRTDNVRMLTFPSLTRNGEEPPAVVAAALSA